MKWTVLVSILGLRAYTYFFGLYHITCHHMGTQNTSTGSESQPMHGDADDGDGSESVLLSTWNEARLGLRAKILISTRKRLLDDRGAFMDWLREHIESQLAKAVAGRREQGGSSASRAAARVPMTPFNQVLAAW